MRWDVGELENQHQEGSVRTEHSETHHQILMPQDGIPLGILRLRND